MTPTNDCPQCRQPLPDDAPQGLCPACLMRLALADDLGAGELALAGVADEGCLAGAAGWMGLGLVVPSVRLRELPDAVGTVAEGAADSPPADAPPATDRYQVLKELARGGMGVVYRGRDLELGRDVALKVLRDKHIDHPQLARRFIEEAQIAGQLQHPGVAPVYELGELADHRPFFSMKLVKGQTLAALLADRHSPSDDQARLVTVFEQVCQTVAYAHARGVVHRDLKPANIMVGAFGEVQVMDWGLAKLLPAMGGRAEADHGERHTSEAWLAPSDDAQTRPAADSVTQSGAVLGTPAYMAPEQARGENERVDERTDVFGLGAILCEILTGQPPFTGSAVEAQRKAGAADLADARRRLADCGADAELVALAGRCLAAQPWDRPQSASELARQLTVYKESVQRRLRQAELDRAAEHARAAEAVLTAEQERRAHAAAQARAEEERRRQRVTMVLAATVVLFVIAAGAGLAFVSHQRQAYREELADQELLAKQAETDRAVAEARSRQQLHQQINDALRQAALAVERAESADVNQWDDAEWQQARDQAERAATLAESPLADDELRSRAAQALAALDERRNDRRLLAALEAAWLAGAEGEQRFAEEKALPLVREALADYGLPLGEGAPGEVAAKIKRRPPEVREAIVAALDEWMMLPTPAPDSEQSAAVERLPEIRPWLEQVVRLADGDAWREAVREAAASKAEANKIEDHRKELERLAEEADVARQPVRSLTRLAAHLRAADSIDRAIGLLRRTQRRHAGDVWANYDLGWALVGVRPPRRAEAVRYLTAASVLRPDSAALRNNLGQVLRDFGAFDEAAAEYREAIRLKPDWAAAHNNLALVLARQREFHEARAEFEEAIRLRSDYAAAHTNLGNMLIEQGRANEALAAYREAVRVDPLYAPAHCQLATALAGKGQPEEALAEFGEAIRLAPDRFETHVNFSEFLLSRNRPTEAISECRTALRLAPDSGFARVNLAAALRTQGNWIESIAELREAVRLLPGFERARTELAWQLAMCPNIEARDIDGALRHAEQAVELAPRDALAYTALAAAHYRFGRWSDAIADLNTSLELNGEQLDAWLLLAMAHWQLGEEKEAIEWYEKAKRRPKTGAVEESVRRLWDEARELLGRTE